MAESTTASPEPRGADSRACGIRAAIFSTYPTPRNPPCSTRRNRPFRSWSSMSNVKLSDSGQTVANAAEDVRGRKVKDKEGKDLGTVDGPASSWASVLLHLAGRSSRGNRASLASVADPFLLLSIKGCATRGLGTPYRRKR